MFGSILISIIVLSVLILVHEFGHFIVAKKSGIRVEEFGFGLPPRIWGKKVGETIYSINALPFGGFVRLYGEQDTENIDTDVKRAFLSKSKKTRSLVIIAGVVMNFLLAIVAFGIVYSFIGIPKDTGRVKVVDVAPSSPAQVAGVLVGDVVKKVNGTDVSSSDEFINQTSDFIGKKVSLEIERKTDGDPKYVKVSLTPRENPPENEGPIGVTITTTEIYFPPVWQRPFYGIYYGFKDGIFWGKTIVGDLGKMIFDAFRGKAPQGVSGPIGIYVVTTEAAKGGFLMLLNFVGIFSVNLAILNIIPFPALDGGRLLFIGIEAITKKRVSRKVEAAINNVGFIILILLLLLVTFGDIKRLITQGGISGFLNSMGR